MAILRKKTCNLRHPMHLCHPVCTCKCMHVCRHAINAIALSNANTYTSTLQMHPVCSYNIPPHIHTPTSRTKSNSSTASLSHTQGYICAAAMTLSGASRLGGHSEAAALWNEGMQVCLAGVHVVLGARSAGVPVVVPLAGVMSGGMTRAAVVLLA